MRAKYLVFSRSSSIHVVVNVDLMRSDVYADYDEVCSRMRAANCRKLVVESSGVEYWGREN
jgi:hypothetical protein